MVDYLVCSQKRYDCQCQIELIVLCGICGICGVTVGFNMAKPSMVV